MTLWLEKKGVPLFLRGTDWQRGDSYVPCSAPLLQIYLQGQVRLETGYAPAELAVRNGIIRFFITLDFSFFLC